MPCPLSNKDPRPDWPAEAGWLAGWFHELKSTIARAGMVLIWFCIISSHLGLAYSSFVLSVTWYSLRPSQMSGWFYSRFVNQDHRALVSWAIWDLLSCTYGSLQRAPCPSWSWPWRDEMTCVRWWMSTVCGLSQVDRRGKGPVWWREWFLDKTDDQQMEWD